MYIRMSGIDHSTASLERRGFFAFTAGQAREAMIAACETSGADACVILSTCNRTELWLSGTAELRCDPVHLLCGLRGLSVKEQGRYIVRRSGEEAVRHLFETACGLRSELRFEDQILSQIKQSLSEAREAQTTDELMERLFQCAVTCGKKVKAQVQPHGDSSVLGNYVLQTVKGRFGRIRGIRCLVVGSGELGRHAAGLLSEAGAEVAVTVRRHHDGMSGVPQNCGAVGYEKRYEALRRAEVVVGATRSPHYTICGADAKELLSDGKRRLLIDLAVPRDFEPALNGVGRTELLDLDGVISAGAPAAADRWAQKEREILCTVGNIVWGSVSDFMDWFNARETLPLLTDSALAVAEKIERRFNASMDGKTPPLSEAGLRLEIGRLLRGSAKQVLLSMFAEMRKGGGDAFLECLKAYVGRERPDGRKIGRRDFDASQNPDWKPGQRACSSAVRADYGFDQKIAP